MSDLIVVGFKGEDTADQVLNKLASLQKEPLIDLGDACVVVRDQSGQVHLKQTLNLVGMGAASGGFSGLMWGTLAGLLLLNPVAGLLTGVTGAALCTTCPASTSTLGAAGRPRPAFCRIFQRRGDRREVRSASPTNCC